MVMKQKPSNVVLESLDLALFFSQFSLLLEGGLPIAQSIAFMAEDQPQHGFLNLLAVELEQDGKLSTAMEQVGCFPAFVISMVMIGERSGRLDDVCQYLGEFYQKAAKYQQEFISALAYPLVLAVLVSVVIGIVIIRILPLFVAVFGLVGTQLSPLAVSLMNFGQLVADNLWVIALLAGILLVLYILWRYTKYKNIISKVVFQLIPGLRLLNYQQGLLVFTNGLRLMIQSGMKLDEAVGLSSQLSDNELLTSRQHALLMAMEQGNNFAEALTIAQLYNKTENRIIATGLKTGKIDQALLKVSLMSEQAINHKISQWIAVVEPSLVVGLTLVVGLILLTVMLPLIGILSSMVG
jgi:type IV pilus assembly protein PilC